MEKKYNAYKKIGRINKDLLKDLNLNFNGDVYIDESVLRHIKKRHGKQLTKHVKENIKIIIERIIKNPDYIGINRYKDNISLKLVKKIDAQVMVILDFDYENEYMYVATMYPLIKEKLNTKILTGVLKTISG